MIQRVQSLYLLGGFILFVLMMFFPIVYFVIGFTSFPVLFTGININNVFYCTPGIIGVLCVASIIQLINIFLYKNRILQMRLVILNCILSVVFYITVIAYLFLLKSDINISSVRVNWPLFMPLIIIILNILAYKNIHHDNQLVRSLDHLR